MLESVASLHKIQLVCGEALNQLFSGWVDLYEVVMSRLDRSYLKYIVKDQGGVLQILEINPYSKVI